MYDPPKQITAETMSVMDNLTAVAERINDLAALIADMHDAGDSSVIGISIDPDYNAEAVRKLTFDSNILVTNVLPGMEISDRGYNELVEWALYIHGVKINTWETKGKNINE